MTRILWIACILAAVATTGTCQTYKYSYQSQKEFFYASFIFCASSYIYRYTQDHEILDEPEDVDFNSLWGIDKNAVYQNSIPAKNWSDITMYASVAFPIALIASNKNLRGESSELIMMGLQGFFIENGITQYIKVIAERPRPFLYREDPEKFGKELPYGATESFISGHTSASAYFSFFAARVFADTNPDSKLKPVVWTAAASLPLVTGYLRYKAGKHFPTDVVSGYIVGGAFGLLIPHIYKSKQFDLQIQTDRLSLTYTF